MKPKLLQLGVFQVGVFQVGIDDLQPTPSTVVEQTTATARPRVSRELQERFVSLRIRAFLDGFGGQNDDSINVNSVIIFSSNTPTGRDLVRDLLANQPLLPRADPILVRTTDAKESTKSSKTVKSAGVFTPGEENVRNRLGCWVVSGGGPSQSQKHGSLVWTQLVAND